MTLEEYMIRHLSEPSFVPETKNLATQFSSRESTFHDLGCNDLLFGDHDFSSFSAR